METTSISYPPTSGNHGRSSFEPQSAGIDSLTPPTTPQQSTRGFVAPAATPVKKTPDITDIVGEKRLDDEMIRRLDDDAESTKGRRDEGAKGEEVKGEKEEGTKGRRDEGAKAEEEIILNSQFSILNFKEQWGAMFEKIFASVPTIYFPLKESLPKIENNIITVDVKNEIQKEHFEAKAREVLEFLRTHYDEKIEDIVVETNEQLETKKIIYDIKDKLQNFKEQNDEFEEFLQVLDLKIKY